MLILERCYIVFIDQYIILKFLNPLFDSIFIYFKPLYWDQRYEFEDKRAMEAGVKNFDWYAPFDKIYPVVESVIDATIKHKILVLGVGKSNIIETLIENGHKDIIAIDISPFIISKMSQKYSYFAGVEFFVLDCRDLSYFSDNTFTLVLDKGDLCNPRK